MLTHLRITDFALLDDVELALGPGLNVLSGETGAGKSLLVDAVALLRGGRASAEQVRSGAEEARIEALFEPPHGPAADALAQRLEHAGIARVEEGLIVRRVIGKNGRGRVYINDTLSTAAALSEVAGVLIELAGQHEHQTLSDSSRHLAILDEFGGLEPLAAQMLARSEACGQSIFALAALDGQVRAGGEREAFLRFVLDELSAAELRTGELEELAAERERLRARERLLGASRRGEEVLYARESAVVDEVGAIARELDELGQIDPRLGAIGRQLGEARALIEDAAGELRHYADGLDADPERLSVVEERLHTIERLLRKHRGEAGDIDGLLRRQAELAAELDALENHEERRAELVTAVDRAVDAAATIARQLSAGRTAAAKQLATRVDAALAEVGMTGARLVPVVTALLARDGDPPALVVDQRRLSATGWDKVELLLAANPGEEPRPLQRVASGGELSRIMLALKRILSRADKVATYVFDEVDAGIGGAVADVVGRQIKQVAGDKQVVCITHLGQIAVFADHHFRVEKTTVEGRTSTVVRRLNAAERRDEIARMIGGKITQKARAYAEELLKAASAS